MSYGKIVNYTSRMFPDTPWELRYNPIESIYVYNIKGIKTWEQKSGYAPHGIMDELERSPKIINRESYIRLISSCSSIFPMHLYPSFNDFKKSKVKIMEPHTKEKDNNTDYLLFEEKKILLKHYVYDINEVIDLSEFAYFKDLSLIYMNKDKKHVYGLKHADILLESV